MLACARRAVVVLSTVVAALAILAPATVAEPRTDLNAPLPIAKLTSPVTGTDLAVSPRHVTIKYGHQAALSARLTSRFGPVKNETVTWWSRRSNGAWQRAGSATTDANGRTSIKRRLTHTTQWQVRYGGDLLQDKSASPVATVKVLPPPPPPKLKPATPAFADRVLHEAARHHGAPYQYGAAGPSTFDCSGFTMYVFGKFGIHLSHNAAAQYCEVRHISAAAKRPGDLIFFTGSSGIYHVGIYVGGGQMWAATHSGDVVRYESIHEASYVVGRVL
jgi:cell wall-associated NlpC family hydrolase